MATGTVKWFDAAKGYGFIMPQDGGADIYLPAKSLQKLKLATLEPNTVIEYEVSGKTGRLFAVEIEVTSNAPLKPVAQPISSREMTTRDVPDAEDDFEKEWGLRRA